MLANIKSEANATTHLYNKSGLSDDQFAIHNKSNFRKEQHSIDLSMLF